MIFFAPIAVDPIHTGQASALSGLLDAAAADSVVGVTRAGLASIETKIPEAGDAVFTFLSPDTVLTHTLACRLWKGEYMVSKVGLWDAIIE